MPKISLSIPHDVLQFIDSQGKNRSRAIVTILQEYKEKKQREELIKAYEEYENFCKEDDANWWSDWENSSIEDTGKDI